LKNDEQLELESILQEFHNVSGFRVSIHDTKFNEIMAYPKDISPYCRLIQGTSVGRCRCIENDLCAFEHVRKDQAVYLYQCCFGLYEAVAPLYVFGNLVGYMMMGQSIDNRESSKDALIQNALSVISDHKSLHEAVDKVCISDKNMILSFIKILDICAQYITMSNRFFLDKSDIADKIKKYLEDNYNQQITIEKICLVFFCSRTTATTAFCKKYRMGINACLTDIRMKAAKKLLRSTSNTIKEIAESCGIPDQNYFCKVFLKHCGMTPSAYRKGNTKGANTVK